MAPRAEISPARRAAYRALLRVFEDDAYADHAFRTAATGLDERDRALAQRLAFGTVQRVRTLDHAIETLGRRKVHRLDPPVRAALRLGAYQLGYVDGVPRYAAVNESVELVRAAGLARAIAFTNAVLRRLAEGIDELLEGLPETSAGQAALKHSYPDWIAETWWRDLGESAALELMRAQNEPAEVAVRLVRGDRGHARSRDSGRVARRPGRRARAFGGPHLATEPGLPARRADGRCAGGRADTRCLRRSRWQGDDVPG